MVQLGERRVGSLGGGRVGHTDAFDTAEAKLLHLRNGMGGPGAEVTVSPLDGAQHGALHVAHRMRTVVHSRVAWARTSASSSVGGTSRPITARAKRLA